jgi:hypothetical protein
MTWLRPLCLTAAYVLPAPALVIVLSFINVFSFRSHESLDDMVAFTKYTLGEAYRSVCVICASSY